MIEELDKTLSGIVAPDAEVAPTVEDLNQTAREVAERLLQDVSGETVHWSWGCSFRDSFRASAWVSGASVIFGLKGNYFKEIEHAILSIPINSLRLP